MERVGASLSAPAEITFEYTDGDVSVEKKFTFDHSYVVGVKTAVQQKGAHVTALPMWPSGFGGETTGAPYALGQIAYQYDNKVERLAIKKISGGGTLPGPFQLGGSVGPIFRGGVHAAGSAERGDGDAAQPG